MVETCFIASPNYPAPILYPEQPGLNRAPKEFLPFLSSCSSRQGISRSSCVNLKLDATQFEDQWKSSSLLSDCNRTPILDPALRQPVLVDVQDVCADSVLFSFGIAEKCARDERILQFLMSGSKAQRGLNLSVLSDLMGLHTVAIDLPQLSTSLSKNDFCLYEAGDGNDRPSLLYPRSEFYLPKPLLDIVGDPEHSSMVTVHPDGRLLFTGTGSEVKDLISVLTEFYQAKNTKKCSERSMLVPYFTRKRSAAVQATTGTVSPARSPMKIMEKPMTKKRNSRKAVTERDLYKKNYIHACESLLSVLSDKRCGKTKILLLKKSGPELPHLLTQFSAGIAGTGLAVILSVLGKTIGGRAPICAAKLLNTGFGLGLVWLSWAVNRLRDIIVSISKNSSRLGINEDELASKVDKNVKEVFFRAATVMAVAVLRFA